MVFEISEIRARKKIKIGDDDAKHNEKEAACHDFLKDIPEDLLLEIFIRLPNSRSAIRTASVCHYWHSLILKNPQFIPRFKSHHQQYQHLYPLPYTIMFRKADRIPRFFSIQHFQPICKLFSEELMLASTLDFMPCPMVIRGSCNDLLLVSPGPRRSPNLYICNPITKQFIQLPPRPDTGFLHEAGHALVCMPGPTNKFRFKVLELSETWYQNKETGLPAHQPIMLYCSESRKWEMRHFHYPQPTTMYGVSWLHGIACNGVLYWLEYEHCEINRVISLDLSNNQCGVIDFPDDCCHDMRRARDQIGVVRVRGGEELRLIQVVLTAQKESSIDLKVWKLSQKDHIDKKEWVLVHQKTRLEKLNKESELALPFLHPTNGDAVFIVWGQEVFQYNLKDTTSTFELIGKLQKSLNRRSGWLANFNLLLQFPVVHMNWPTQILA